MKITKNQVLEGKINQKGGDACKSFLTLQK
jgi:hypothetical protein